MNLNGKLQNGHWKEVSRFIFRSRLNGRFWCLIRRNAKNTRREGLISIRSVYKTNHMCGGLRKPGWSRKKSFHVKWLNVKFFPYVSHYLSNFWKFIKNQRVKRFVKNKKHVIKYEQGKPKQKLTHFFYFSTSAWFPQTATHIRNTY